MDAIRGSAYVTASITSHPRHQEAVSDRRIGLRSAAARANAAGVQGSQAIVESLI
jgi:hypothetical protein